MWLRIQSWLARHIHRAIYLGTGKRVGGGTMSGLQIVMLTTTGRKTGKPRTTPLNALVDGGRWIIVASNAGMDTHPHWYGNLLASPKAAIEVQRERVPVVARVAGPEERAAYWARITSQAKNYLGYEKKTSREIPLVVLERA